MSLRAGEPAPDFTLPDQRGDSHSLADYRGKWVLVYFYPKDDTPGCTIEACGIRDTWAEFQARDIVVLGISPDSVKRHAKFVDKYDLPFTLLADAGKDVVQLYDVWGRKKFMGRSFLGTRRASFLIAPDGRIAKVYDKVKPAKHAEEVLQDVENLRQ